MITPSEEILQSIGMAGGHFEFETLLVVEAPISFAQNVKLFGTNYIGQLSYLAEEVVTQNVSIGRYCSIADHVSIGVTQHPTDRLSTHPFTYNWNAGPDTEATSPFEHCEAHSRVVDRKNLLPRSDIPRTIIGNDVWIGRQATIMPGLIIGDGAVVGANSVVTHNVAPYTIVGGVPARRIRQRFEDGLVAKLIRVKWWDYDLAPLQGKIDYRDVALCVHTLEQVIECGHAIPLCPEIHILKSVRGNLCHFVSSTPSIKDSESFREAV
jgi:virginiamycin A acetyltransferase